MMTRAQNIVRLFVFFSFFGAPLSAKKSSTRRKRLLHFPEKTNVVLTMSLLKLFPSESILNTLTEYDVSFPVPLHPYKLPSNRLKRQVERDIIGQKLGTIADDIISSDGDGSRRNLICVMKKFFNSGNRLEDNLLKDVANILFNLGSNTENCSR